MLDEKNNVSFHFYGGSFRSMSVKSSLIHIYIKMQLLTLELGRYFKVRTHSNV